MSGILEQILAEVQAIRAMITANAPVAVGQFQPQQQFAQPHLAQAQYAQQQTFNPAMLQGPGTTAPQNVTADMITALIQPHLGSDVLKKALGDTMRAMGINALPEIQPHQYGEVYQRFQGVIQQFQANPNPAPTQAAAPASII